eukprot:119237-Chlamydomonas_euryale.AAC.1
MTWSSGKKYVLKYAPHPAVRTRSASAALPTAGVAKLMQRSRGAGHSGSSRSSRSAHSFATAPPSEWPHSTSRRLDAAACSYSRSTSMLRARARKPECAAGTLCASDASAAASAHTGC